MLLLILNPIIGLMYTVGLFSKTKINFKTLRILTVGIVFFFLGYSIILTNQNADIARYISWLPNYHFLSLNEVITQSIEQKNIFVLQPLMLSFFSKLPNIKFFTGFIPLVFYTSYSYISISFFAQTSFEKRTCNKKSWVFYFGLTIISFGWVLTSVRNPMANSLISVALFRDLFLNKRGIVTLLFYFLGLSMHVAVLPIIFCRILFGIFFSENNLKKLLSFVFGVFLLFVGLRSNVLQEFSSKTDVYGIGSTGGGFAEYAQSSIYYVINNLFLLWLMALSIFLIVIIKKQKAMNTKLFDFLSIISVLSIVSYFLPTPLIDRYGMIIEIFYPLILMNVNFSALRKNTRFLLITGLYFTGIFGFLWQLAFLSIQIDILTFFKNIFFGWLSTLI